ATRAKPSHHPRQEDMGKERFTLVAPSKAKRRVIFATLCAFCVWDAPEKTTVAAIEPGQAALKTVAAPWTQGEETYCYSTSEVSWISDGGHVLVRDGRGSARKVRIRGVNWRGFETPAAALEGLDTVDMEHVLISLQSRWFNAIRVPISLELALGLCAAEAARTDICGQGESSADQIHRLLMRAAAHGLLVMLDMNSLHAVTEAPVAGGSFGGGSGGSTSSDTVKYSPEEFIAGWGALLDEFGTHPNLFAIDAFDGPLFSAQWSSGPAGSRAVDYEDLVQRLAAELLAAHADFRGLLGIMPVREEDRRLADRVGSGGGGGGGDGSGGSFGRNSSRGWSESSGGGDNSWDSVATGKAWDDRIVYTPHVASVALGADSHSPDLLPPLLDKTFGGIERNGSGHAVLAIDLGPLLAGDTPMPVAADALVAAAAAGTAAARGGRPGPGPGM
ncbi:unnamed protein product, partial [Phaeothamnion confervicola]